MCSNTKVKSAELLQKVKNDYNQIAAHFSQTRAHDWEEFSELIPHLKPHQTLLDLACGNGRLLNFLEKQPNTPTYIGIDNSENLLKEAQKLHPKAKLIEGDMLQIPLPDQSADIVTNIAAFHHLPDNETRTQTLNEIHRTLKPQGLLFLTVWNLDQPRFEKCHRQNRDFFIPFADSGVDRYYYGFKPEELANLLNHAGFQIIKETHNKNHTYLCQKS